MSPANPPGGGPSVGSIVDRFERLWQSGRRPDPERFVASLPEALRMAVLVEVLHADLEFRLKAGEMARVEDYLTRFPLVAARAEMVGELVVTEYRFRRRREPGLDLSEYRRRFPEVAIRLEALPPSRRDWERTTVVSPPPERAVTGLPAVPGYETLGELGRGGMGVVYKARHVGLNRVVALKMLLHEGLDPETLARFRIEGEAAARLRHPNIVQVYEVGDSGGRPYFALEYVEGGTLARRLAGTPAEPRWSAAVAETLARAVGAAHEKGVVHRDLKPANVLVAEDDTPKVADFGLAKRLDDDSGQTKTGQVMGTPSYMAPEQAAGQKVGAACDVYSLGAILYEMLTGRPPFRAPTVFQTLEQVRACEPVPPRLLNPDADRDLETICLKCLQKEPARRYTRAVDLADDLRRYLAGEPITARPVTGAERLWKWVRRQPAMAAAYALLAAASVLGGVGGTMAWLWQDAEAARRSAAAAREEADGKNELLQILNSGLAEAKDALAGKNKDLAAANDELKLARNQVEQAAALHRVELARRELEGNRPAAAERLLMLCAPQFRHWEWHYIRRQLHTDLETVELKDYAGAVGVRVSPDGNRYVTTGKIKDHRPGTDEYLKVWDAVTHKEVFSTKVRGLRNLRWTDGGKGLVWLEWVKLGPPVAFPGRKPTPLPESDGAVVVSWDEQAGRKEHRLTWKRAEVGHVVLAPDGGRVFLVEEKQQVTAWDFKTGEKKIVVKAERPWTEPYAFAVDREGQRFALGVYFDDELKGSAIRLFNLTTGKESPPCKAAGSLGGLVWSPDGRFLAAGGGETKEVTLWDPETGKQLFSGKGSGGGVSTLAFSADGRQLAAAWAVAPPPAPVNQGGIVSVWDIPSGRETNRLQGHRSDVTSVDFSPDGRRLWSAGADATLKVWDVRGGGTTTIHPNSPATEVAFSPDGKTLATDGGYGFVTLWEAATGQEVRTLTGHVGQMEGVAFSPDGHMLASGGLGLGVKFWEVQSGKALRVLAIPQGSSVNAIRFSPDGRRLAAAGSDLHEVKESRVEVEPGKPPATLRTSLFKPILLVWDVNTGQVVLKEHGGTPGQVLKAFATAFSPDGKWLASSLGRDAVQVWDAATGEKMREFELGGSDCKAIGFSPDSKRLGAVGNGRGFKVWEVATGRQVLAPEGHTGDILGVSFSPDGKRIVTSGNDRTVRLWDAETGQETICLRGHEGGISSVCFSRDGSRIASASADGTVRIWDGSPLSR